jgi:hypothetical protein
LRAYTIDVVGHCALQVVMNLNEAEPDEGICKFSIRAEAAAINRLGELFNQLSKLKHLEFRWNLRDDELYEQHQETYVTSVNQS